MKQKFQTLKKAIDGKLHWIVGAVIVIQPALDVLSYFLGELGNNSFSTALRFLLLMAVALLGFVVSDKKRVYVIFYGIMGAFGWPTWQTATASGTSPWWRTQPTSCGL